MMSTTIMTIQILAKREPQLKKYTRKGTLHDGVHFGVHAKLTSEKPSKIKGYRITRFPEGREFESCHVHEKKHLRQAGAFFVFRIFAPKSVDQHRDLPRTQGGLICFSP